MVPKTCSSISSPYFPTGFVFSSCSSFVNSRSEPTKPGGKPERLFLTSSLHSKPSGTLPFRFSPDFFSCFFSLSLFSFFPVLLCAVSILPKAIFFKVVIFSWTDRRARPKWTRGWPGLKLRRRPLQRRATRPGPYNTSKKPPSLLHLCSSPCFCCFHFNLFLF